MVKFEWRVDQSGYKWDPDAQPNCGDAILLEPVSWTFRAYAPLDKFTGLFRTFAYTAPTKEGIVKFANEFGSLGYQTDSEDAEDPVDDYPEDYSEYDTTEQREWLMQQVPKDSRMVDTLAQWKEAIERMRIVVDLWDRTQKARVPDASAMELIRVMINNELANEDVHASFEECSKKGRSKLTGFALHFVPKGLLGALWVQFALAVGGNKEYRACSVCGTWMELTPDLYRTTRYYCSDACRSRAYR